MYLLIYMNKYNFFIFFIIFLKIVFISLSLISIYLKRKTKEKPETQEDSKLIIQIDYWEMRFEFIFNIMMSILLIYVFNPNSNNLYLITNETKFLLYLFGVILIIKSNWSEFFNEFSWFSTLQKVLST
jgi:hypothetical protein